MEQRSHSLQCLASEHVLALPVGACTLLVICQQGGGEEKEEEKKEEEEKDEC